MRSVGHGFSKTLLCPSSEELLSFSTKPSANDRHLLIAHIAECGFCDAEMRFLSKYPPPPVTIEPAVMPAHLRLLAQCLLSDLGLKELSQLKD
jgi:hypothetical protein